MNGFLPDIVTKRSVARPRKFMLFQYNRFRYYKPTIYVVCTDNAVSPKTTPQ